MKELNKIKLAVFPIILAVALIILLFFVSNLTKKYEELVNQISYALTDLKTYVKDPSKAPSKRQLKQILNFKRKFEELIKHNIYTFKSMKNQDMELKLLEFKEQLTEVDSNYAKYNIEIPKGIGFKEYQGYTLPSASEMKSLSIQLSFVMQMIDLLIENNVEMISDVKRLPVEKVNSTLKTKKLFDIYNFKFAFKISHKNFLEYWDTLLSLPRVIKVKGFDVKSNFTPGDSSLAGQLIDVKMHLCLMEFEE